MATVSDTPEDKNMPLLDHLIELRQRLLYCVVALLEVFGICFYFAQPIFAYLAQPLADVMLEHGIAEHQRRMNFTVLTEVFRSEERRVGTECVSTWRSRRATPQSNKTQ